MCAFPAAAELSLCGGCGAPLAQGDERARIDDAAIERARASRDDSALALAHFARAFSRVGRRELDLAMKDLDVAARLNAEVGDPILATRLVAYRALVHRFLGDEGSTRIESRRLRAIAQTRGMPEYAGVALANEAWLAWRAGDRDEARRLAEDAMRLWQPPSPPFPFQWLAGWFLLEAAIDGEDVEAAVAVAARALERDQERPPEVMERALRVGIEGRDMDAFRRALALARARGDY